MSDDHPGRIDKFLWTVRIYKTRSLATEECRKGRVIIGGFPVKPSRTIKPGEIILVRKAPVNYTYQVVALPGGRLPAKKVPEFIKDLTPASETDKLKFNDSFFVKRDRGTGRPTKKERRVIDKLRDPEDS